MAAKECEIEMTLEILDEVAFLFVEQFDNLYGMLVDRTDVKRIRKSADDGEDGLFREVASVFGDKLDDVFVGAANGAMDYICLLYTSLSSVFPCSNPAHWQNQSSMHTKRGELPRRKEVFYWRMYPYRKTYPKSKQKSLST